MNIQFDLTGTKKTKLSVAEQQFEAQKELIKATLSAKTADIKMQGVKVINEHQANPEIVNSLKEQVKELCQEAELASNMELKALCQKHNRTVEKLDTAEQIGQVVAVKIQSTIIDNRVGRAARGFFSGIAKGWSGK